ncbi:MAG TPA: hypothetical protein PLN61_06975 [bacterium]|nr:hypothetical protein [bacterium]HQJ64481.1 hypothetical protein [bacterium]
MPLHLMNIAADGNRTGLKSALSARRGGIFYPGVLLLPLAALLLACTTTSTIEYESALPAQKRLVHSAGWDNTHPAWHPGGQSLLFCARAVDGSGPVYLREVRVADSSVRTLTADSTGLWFPSWSPVDSTILCTSGRAGSQDLWLYMPAVNTWRRLTSLAGNESFPCWNPDGSRIAFLTLGRIALLEPATAVVTYLNTPFLIALSLSWSPDGASLLFSADNASGEYLYRYQLADNRAEELLMSATAGSWPVAVRVVADGGAEHLAWRAMTSYGSTGIFFDRPGAETPSLIVLKGAMPAWSPDGTALVHVEDLQETPVETGLDLVWDKIWIRTDE